MKISEYDNIDFANIDDTDIILGTFDGTTKTARIDALKMLFGGSITGFEIQGGEGHYSIYSDDLSKRMLEVSPDENGVWLRDAVYTDLVQLSRSTNPVSLRGDAQGAPSGGWGIRADYAPGFFMIQCDSSGNVGIGNNFVPTGDARLEVNGFGRFTSDSDGATLFELYNPSNSFTNAFFYLHTPTASGFNFFDCRSAGIQHFVVTGDGNIITTGSISALGGDISFASGGNDIHGITNFYDGATFGDTATFGAGSLIMDADGNISGDGFTFNVGGAGSVTGDFEITSNAKGLVLKSPNSTRYRVSVSNLGVLATTAI